jgi:RHS repeat-associated protein
LVSQKSVSNPRINYVYGFQGQERDDEIKGDGNSLNYEFRMHDPRIGRFFAVDPLTREYPHYTPYSFSGNRVIDCIELEGKEEYHYTLTYKDNDKSKPQKTDWKKVENSWLKNPFSGEYVSYEVHIKYQGETYTFKGKWADGLLTDAFIADPDNPMWKNSIYNDNTRLKLQEAIEEVIDNTPLGVVKKTITPKTKKPEGVIYKRKDKNKTEKDYVGQAKSKERYEARKKEHQRNNKDADYEFEEIDRGTPGKDLDQKEQNHIDAGGGPTNKSNPNGGLSNKKNVISKKKR